MIIWTDGDPSACAHPLNATEAQILALGLDGKLTMSNGEQTCTYTIQGGLPDVSAYGSASIADIDFSSGVKSIEINYNMPNINSGSLAGNNLYATATLKAGPTTSTPVVAVILTASEYDGTTQAAVNIGFTNAYTGACPSSGRFTIIIDGGTGAVIVKLNGTPLPLLVSTITPQPLNILMSVIEDDGINVLFSGQTASITTVTDSRRIVYGSGFTICGQVITP